MGQKIGFDPAKFSAKDFAIKVTADAAAKTAVYGGSFQDNLISAAVSNATLVAGAYGAGEIGDLGLTEGGVPKVVLHAALGGLMAEAMGGDFKSGALVGGVNEAVVGYLGDYLLPEGVSKQSVEYKEAEARLIAASQIIGVLTASVSKGDVNIAAAVAQNATEHNYAAHWSEFEKQYAACSENPAGSGCSTVLKMAGVGNQHLGNVVINKGHGGEVVSYVLIDESGKPWMIMEPDEYKVYVTAPQHVQEGYKTTPQWQLNLASELLYAYKGDVDKAAESYGFMLRDSGYKKEMLLALALGAMGRVALGAKQVSAALTPRNAANLSGGPLQSASRVSGRFKLDGGPPNTTLYRADNQGNITSYAVYDSEGMILRRVDVTGAAHANVPTPHVIEYGRNKLPDGSVRVQSPSTKLPPRPAKPEEIP